MNPLDLFRAHWGQANTIAPLGQGHINATWRVDADDGSWVLQQINRHVFRDPGRVMDNLQRVLLHVRTVPLPELRRTQRGETQVVVDGEWYRVWRFIAAGVAKKQPATLQEAEVAADAFGRLQAALRDLPGDLPPSIAGFHSLAFFHRRYRDLQISSAFDDLIARCLDDAGRLSSPTGVIHGDCKFENVLLSADGLSVLAILDLDTLMRGHWGFDWGDLVRSAFVAQGTPQEPLYRALLRGFCRHLTQIDREALQVAPVYVACTLGVRYLVDHHEGDRWFRVEQHGDNLPRAERQFRFAMACEAMAPVIRDWIDSELSAQA